MQSALNMATTGDMHPVDVTGSPLLLMAALGLGGLIAGAIAVRTRSLLLPVAVHIGLDIPIYYAFACGT